MNLSSSRPFVRGTLRGFVAVTVLCFLAAPAMAQNKKNSWEVFLYFGSFYSNDIPSAKQFGNITTYRTDPFFAVDPTNLAEVFTPNLGKVGGQNPPDPNYPFDPVAGDPGNQFGSEPCLGNNGPLVANDPREPFYDECDNDQESRYLYNANGITTNGAIQRDDSEFTLGIRGGYNFTRHWEFEFDLGFGKQRVDLTKNLAPLLHASVDDVNDPLADDLADFYQFTWANIDYYSIVVDGFNGEHPNVVASRRGANPTFDIPKYFPFIWVTDPNNPSGPKVPKQAMAGETFQDVTGFVNRIFQDPTAFRNRGNQINIDTFAISGSVNYNFNTKADSRVIPYLAAGVGKWMRNFDSPYNGDDTNFLTYGGGVRFFVNEIFSFRMDARLVHFLDDTFTITGSLNNFNLPDRIFNNFGNCVRDNRDIRPPCPAMPGNPDPSWAFPNLSGGGGNAAIEVEAELDDFYEIRLGFDVILGGK